MNQYIYTDSKSFKFFMALDSSEARQKVISFGDMSLNPSFFAVTHRNSNSFIVKNDLFNLNLKQSFKLLWSGENQLCFSLVSQLNPLS